MKILCFLILFFLLNALGLEAQQWTTYTIASTANGLASNVVNAIAVDASNNKWFGTSNGVSKFDGTKWTNYTTKDGLINNTVNAIAIDASGNKWFGTNIGVSKFNDTIWTNYTTSKGLVNNFIHTIAIDAAGNKWFGTNGGASKFNDTIFTNFTLSSGLPSSTVNAIAFDQQKNIWFGTWGGGVSKFDGNKWINYTTSNGLILDDVRAIAIDVLNNKWVGTGTITSKGVLSVELGGVSMYNDTSWISYNIDNGMVDNFIRSIAIDAFGNKWFGTNGGVSKFDGTNWLNYDTISGLANNCVLAVAIDKQKIKWFGTNGGGVSTLNDVVGIEEFNAYLMINIFPNPTQNSLTFKNIPDGKILIYSISGQLVLQSIVNSTAKIIDISSLPSGLYFVKLISEHQILSAKFIKE